jgi:hypothetical protein
MGGEDVTDDGGEEWDDLLLVLLERWCPLLGQQSLT